jgi:hypothetical protein
VKEIKFQNLFSSSSLILLQYFALNLYSQTKFKFLKLFNIIEFFGRDIVIKFIIF